MSPSNVTAIFQEEARAAEPFWSVVAEVLGDGFLRIGSGSGVRRAMLATHVPPVLPGQHVLVMPGAKDMPALVVAAYPPEGQMGGLPLSYEPGSGTLEIRGVKIKLVGQREVVVECGDASFVVSEDGAVQTRGDRILSAAMETNRIEGGSIEFN
ncbi:MAG: hypothetical protein FWG56_04700 [Desulfovibrionaceae bacterium]|nr:hypothetical protein [Desulfovibrionaceae bacterium]